MNIFEVSQFKARNGKSPLVMLTAYDAPTSQIANNAGVDIILVGDSLAMVVLGYPDTLQLSLEEMQHHVAAVARPNPAPAIVADMPWMSYHSSVKKSVLNAAKLVRAGAQAVKIEGGKNRLKVIKALVDAEIPVMGHLGLTPQSINRFGDYNVQAKTIQSAKELLDDAEAIAEAGCFAVVLEAIPSLLAQIVTERLQVPVIGIGAGPYCDGQVLVFHDLVGFREGSVPKFVRKYTDLSLEATNAVIQYTKDVRSGDFPSVEETYYSKSLFSRQDLLS